MNEQRSDNWRSDRLGMITGSRAPDLNGSAERRRTLAYTLVAELLQRDIRPQYMSDHMKRGVEQESEILARYELQTNQDCIQAGLLVDSKNPLFGYSPDGLVGSDGLVEIKSRIAKEQIRTVDQGIPKEALAQVQWGLFVTGRDWADYVSFCDELPFFAQLFILRVKRDNEHIEKLVKAARQVAQHVNDIMDKLGIEL